MGGNFALIDNDTPAEFFSKVSDCNFGSRGSSQITHIV